MTRNAIIGKRLFSLCFQLLKKILVWQGGSHHIKKLLIVKVILFINSKKDLIFFGLGASNTKKNENEIKTFKLKKVKPTYHYKI